MKGTEKMKIERQLQRVAACGLALLAAINPARSSAQANTDTPPVSRVHYKFTTLEFPTNSSLAFVYGINDKGLASGEYIDGTGYTHAYLWEAGTSPANIVTVNTPGWVENQFGGISDAGVAIGDYDDDQTVSHAAMYQVHDHVWITLPDIAGMPWSYGEGINNSGGAVGDAYNNTFTEQVGWIWDGRHYSLFTVPASAGSMFGFYVTGINDGQDVVGWYQDSEEALHGFLKRGPRLDAFDVPGASGTQAYAVNDLGDVAGFYWTLGPANGFVCQAGRFVTVNVPGATETEILCINNLGQIGGIYFVGTYVGPNYLNQNIGTWYAFVATPIRDGDN
jgi:uncharacterized membrane protein